MKIKMSTVVLNIFVFFSFEGDKWRELFSVQGLSLIAPSLASSLYMHQIPVPVDCQLGARTPLEGKSLVFLFSSFPLPLFHRSPEVCAPAKHKCCLQRDPSPLLLHIWINTFLTSWSLPQLHLCICSHLCMCIHVYTCVHVWVPKHTKHEYLETKGVSYHPALLSNLLVQVWCVTTHMYLLAYLYSHMGRNTCVCVHMCVHRGLKSRSGVFLNLSPLYLLRQSHWQSLDINDSS